jgi:hypothetical protein
LDAQGAYRQLSLGFSTVTVTVPSGFTVMWNTRCASALEPSVPQARKTLMAVAAVFCWLRFWPSQMVNLPVRAAGWGRLART